MPIQKQPLNINFSQGLDTKTDPFQVAPGKFLVLENTVFNKGGLLQKRNGFGLLNVLSGASTITNYQDSLIAIGSSVQAYSTNGMINTGLFQPIDLEAQPLVRRATSQTTVDVAVAENGLALSTWLDSNGSSYYQISNSLTSQTVVPAVLLPATATMSRAYVLGRYFIVTFLATVSGSPHLQYVAIPILDPTSPTVATDFSTDVSSISAAYDAYVSGNNLYISWDGNDGGGAIRTKYMTSTLGQSNTVLVAGQAADLISVTVDNYGVSPIIWVSFYKLSTNTIKSVAYGNTLGIILATTTVVSAITINELTSVATNSVLTLFYEVANTYTYTPNAKTDYISKNTVTIAGSVGTPAVVLRSVGLASKAFYMNDMTYMLATYGQTYQPTYFLIDSSGNIISKVAYSNGGGYLINQVLPNVNIFGNTAQIGYLFKDLLAAVNRTQGVANTNGVYSQTGINLASFTFESFVDAADIGNNLHISSGLLWMYDGVKPVEHGFNVWPEDITAVPSTTGGSLSDQIYFYQVVYEWTDNQGNIHRSSPSVPVIATVSGGGGSGSVTLNIPYLRLTYKIENKVRIVIYRWSAAQQSYYRVTSIVNPTLNVTTSDSLAYVDTLSDASILGNDLIYTTGGVLENIASPGASGLALFDSRLWVIVAENRNLLGYSRQIIQDTPAEFSDFLTIYVPPSIGSQEETGPISAISSMDDKLIIFKKNVINYIAGTGPDNTGANNGYSEPTFVSSTVGSDNPKSIVLTPNGLMFQSDKGIWLLSRNLQTTYVGAPVDGFNDRLVTSAVVIPGTNQVRFTLDDRATLVYDYYYDQWSSFKNLPAISSTIFEGLHTYLNTLGQLLQETPGSYLDVSSPVLMSFTTSWLNLAGLQGFERAYFFYFLGQYFSPHKITAQVAYDYNPSPSQSVVVTPDNFSGVYGSDTLYGGSTYGGKSKLEQQRIFFDQQKCQSFQITLTESFDPSMGTIAGAGFTLSGLDVQVGIKDSKPKLSAARSAG